MKIHEILGHGSQAAAGNWYTDEKGTAIQEVEAYDVELKHAKDIGLSEKEIEEIKKRRKQWYDKLNDANKKKVDKGDYTLAFLPPGNRSIGTLSGSAQVFVAGEVYAEETTLCTVRGPRTFEGMVIQTEINGKSSRTEVGNDGRASVPWIQTAGAITAATVAIVRVFDSGGREVCNWETRVLPGPPPDVVDPPFVNDIPANLRRGDVLQLTGKNFGRECEMVIGDQIQETLATSSKELIAFVDGAKTGMNDVYLRNPYGESRSFECNIFRFDVTAPKTTITTGEHVRATAIYESLKPGTEVRFENLTPNVVDMRIDGARMEGNTAIVIISRSSGTINVNLTGKMAGAYSISYTINHAK